MMLFLGTTVSYAQSTVSTTGGEASGTGGSVSYTVGQLDYMTFTGTGGSVSQGVQQAYDITVTAGIDEPFGIDLGLNAFPNPTVDYLTLSVDNYADNNLTYTLYDLNGRILETNAVTGNLTTIEMSTYDAASYFLKIVQNESEVKTFNIIKNQ